MSDGTETMEGSLPGIPVSERDTAMLEEPGKATRDESGDSVVVDHANRRSIFSCSGTTRHGGPWNTTFVIPHSLPRTVASMRLWRWHSSEAGGRGGGGAGQRISDHVAQMFNLYYQLFGPPDPDSFTHLLYHDLGEIDVGDVSHVAKRNNPDLKALLDEKEAAARVAIVPELAELGPDMPWRVKFCDLCEARGHLISEHLHGNLMAAKSIIDCVVVLMDHLDSIKGDMATEADVRDWERAAEETLEPWTHVR